VSLKPVEQQNDGTLFRMLSAASLAVAAWLVLNPYLGCGPICDIACLNIFLAILVVVASVVTPTRTDCNIRLDLKRGTPIARKIFPAEPRATLVQQSMFGGGHRAAGFHVSAAQLPGGVFREDLDALVAKVRADGGGDSCLTRQQAFRLLLGCALEVATAVEKSREVVAWRQRHSMAEVRQQHASRLHQAQQVSFTNHEDMSQVMIVNPCAFATVDGRPMTIWHAGTMNASAAAAVQHERLVAWSRSFFEYVDLWVSERSEKTGCLSGHIQVFNLEGVNVWHLAASASLGDKLKAAFSAASYYVESTSHIYIINTSPLFTRLWRGIQGLITPRTASKITVASGVPEELLAQMPSTSSLQLLANLRSPAKDAPALRPC